MKKVLILTGSIRKEGNSKKLAEAFAKGAKETGKEVELIDCARLNVGACMVCNQCFKNGDACIQKDDFSQVASKIEQADCIVFATPIYWFSFSAKLKAVIDKFYSFYVAKKDISGKKVVLLACGEATEAVTGDGIITTYHLIADYLKWKNVGEVCALGYGEAGAITGALELEQAEKLGKMV